MFTKEQLEFLEEKRMSKLERTVDYLIISCFWLGFFLLVNIIFLILVVSIFDNLIK